MSKVWEDEIRITKMCLPLFFQFTSRGLRVAGLKFYTHSLQFLFKKYNTNNTAGTPESTSCCKLLLCSSGKYRYPPHGRPEVGNSDGARVSKAKKYDDKLEGWGRVQPTKKPSVGRVWIFHIILCLCV